MFDPISKYFAKATSIWGASHLVFKLKVVLSMMVDSIYLQDS